MPILSLADVVPTSICRPLHKILGQTLQALPGLLECLHVFAECEAGEILADAAMLLTVELRLGER